MTDIAERSSDIFCEKCDNILDITMTRPLTDNVLESDTPTNVSSDDDDDKDIKDDGNGDQGVDYESMLKKIEAGNKLTYEELRTIDIKNMVKNEYYKKMAKKGEIKKSIIDMIDDMGNADDNTRAYMICKNCAFSKNIEPGFRILSKNLEGGDAMTDNYISDAFYRNKVHIRTMPVTRNFNCPNKNCPVYTEKIAPEAIFFRKNANTYETIYVCKRCLTVKMN
jgi:hypothetical protein